MTNEEVGRHQLGIIECVVKFAWEKGGEEEHVRDGATGMMVSFGAAGDGANTFGPVAVAVVVDDVASGGERGVWTETGRIREIMEVVGSWEAQRLFAALQVAVGVSDVAFTSAVGHGVEHAEEEHVSEPVALYVSVHLAMARSGRMVACRPTVGMAQSSRLAFGEVRGSGC